MIIKPGVSLQGLHPVMRMAMREADRIWIELGRKEGTTITSGTDGQHGPTSWHYFGFAFDNRTGYQRHNLGEDIDEREAEHRLKQALPQFDIIVHKGSHIHIEIGDVLAKELGVLY